MSLQSILDQIVNPDLSNPIRAICISIHLEQLQVSPSLSGQIHPDSVFVVCSSSASQQSPPKIALVTILPARGTQRARAIIAARDISASLKFKQLDVSFGSLEEFDWAIVHNKFGGQPRTNSLSPQSTPLPQQQQQSQLYHQKQMPSSHNGEQQPRPQPQHDRPRKVSSGAAAVTSLWASLGRHARKKSANMNSEFKRFASSANGHAKSGSQSAPVSPAMSSAPVFGNSLHVPPPPAIGNIDWRPSTSSESNDEVGNHTFPLRQNHQRELPAIPNSPSVMQPLSPIPPPQPSTLPVKRRIVSSPSYAPTVPYPADLPIEIGTPPIPPTSQFQSASSASEISPSNSQSISHSSHSPAADRSLAPSSPKSDIPPQDPGNRPSQNEVVMPLPAVPLTAEQLLAQKIAADEARAAMLAEATQRGLQMEEEAKQRKLEEEQALDKLERDRAEELARNLARAKEVRKKKEEELRLQDEIDKLAATRRKMLADAKRAQDKLQWERSVARENEVKAERERRLAEQRGERESVERAWKTKAQSSMDSNDGKLEFDLTVSIPNAWRRRKAIFTWTGITLETTDATLPSVSYAWTDFSISKDLQDIHVDGDEIVPPFSFRFVSKSGENLTAFADSDEDKQLALGVARIVIKS